MNIESPEGTKVRCINHSKCVMNWGSNDSPEDLIIGDIYTVDHTEIHSYHTKVFLKEFPGKKFGTGHFEGVEQGD